MLPVTIISLFVGINAIVVPPAVATIIEMTSRMALDAIVVGMYDATTTIPLE